MIIERPRAERRALAESIPPSADKVLAALGMLPAVQDARFHPWRGNTVWWGTDASRVEAFPDGVSGYQVDRARFDALLRDLAAGLRRRDSPGPGPRRRRRGLRPEATVTPIARPRW